MEEKVSMFLIVDVNENPNTSIEALSKRKHLPLGFFTKEEAELFLKPGQKVIERDGCPKIVAEGIVKYSYIIAFKNAPKC